jgi:hypothetical protein
MTCDGHPVSEFHHHCHKTFYWTIFERFCIRCHVSAVTENASCAMRDQLKWLPFLKAHPLNPSDLSGRMWKTAECTPVVRDVEDTPELDFIAPDNRRAGAGPHAWIVYITTLCWGGGGAVFALGLLHFRAFLLYDSLTFGIISHKYSLGRMLSVDSYLSLNFSIRRTFQRLEYSEPWWRRVSEFADMPLQVLFNRS